MPKSKDLNLSPTLQKTNLPFTVQDLPHDHAFKIALKRHVEAAGILEALNNIEACRLDAMQKMKTTETGSDQHSEYAAAFAVLSSKRKEAKQRYAQYYGAAMTELKKA